MIRRFIMGLLDIKSPIGRHHDRAWQFGVSVRRVTKKIFCRHQTRVFVSNLNGDAILYTGGKRSVWTCQRCGCVILNNMYIPTIKLKDDEDHDEPWF